MSSDEGRGDAPVVAWTPAGRAPRRIVFEPQASGGYTRVEQARREDGVWRTVGTEPVEHVEMENTTDA